MAQIIEGELAWPWSMERSFRTRLRINAPDPVAALWCYPWLRKRAGKSLKKMNTSCLLALHAALPRARPLEMGSHAAYTADEGRPLHAQAVLSL